MPFKFSYSNSKMSKLADMLGLKRGQVASADLPAGYTCPGADLCKSYAHRVTGRVTDGKNSQFRCYAASLEAVFSSARSLHWSNFEAVNKKSVEQIADEIGACITNNLKVVRIHSSGDFYTLNYFLGWLEVAQNFPGVDFFGYTKVLPYLSFPKPDNFHLVYSMGGKWDNVVTDEPYAKVVQSKIEAQNLGLPVAFEIHPADDYTFVLNGRSFALIIHGVQPKKQKNTWENALKLIIDMDAPLKF